MDCVALGSHCASRPRVRTGSGPGIPLSGPAIYASRSRSRPAWARPAPARGPARESSWARSPSHPAPLRPGSRDRRATREIMPLADVLAGHPTISTPALAGRVIIPRPGWSPQAQTYRPGGADPDDPATRAEPTLDRPCAHTRLSDDPATRAEPPPRRGGAAVRTRSAAGTGSPPPSVRPTRTSAPAPARGPARVRRRGGRQLRLGQPGRGPRARRRASPGRTAMHRGDVGPSTAPSRSSAAPLSLCYAPSPFTVRGKGA